MGEVDPIRQKALELARNWQESPEQIAARAAVYERYLRGEVKSDADPLPIPPDGDGYPDALHG